jgi:glycosyltransferase involved in cell wall biosynthesis
MRILHTNAAYAPFVGGAETYLQAMSERLARDGHSVTVATTDATSVQCFWDPRQPRVRERKVHINGVDVVRSPVRHLPGSPWSFYVLRRLATDLARLPFEAKSIFDAIAPAMPRVPGMERTLEELSPGFDLVHGVNISIEWPLIAGRRYAKRHGLPFVATPLLHVGEREVQRFYTMPHQLGALRDADRVVAMTDIEARGLAEQGIAPGRIVRLGAGVDLGRLQGGDAARFRVGYGVDGPVVTFVGAVTDDKGIVHLLRAMQHLWAEGSRATLVIVGRSIKPSSFEREYEGLTDSHRSRIRRMGPVSDSQKQDILAATDVFAMPSRVDSFGIVYLEAWAYRVPVVGCRAGGVPDVIDDGRDGVLVPFGDPAALASAVGSLLADPDRRRAMGQLGRTKVEAHFTWDRIYEGLRGIYEDLVAAASPPQGKGRH